MNCEVYLFSENGIYKQAPAFSRLEVLPYKVSMVKDSMCVFVRRCGKMMYYASIFSVSDGAMFGIIIAVNSVIVVDYDKLLEIFKDAWIDICKHSELVVRGKDIVINEYWTGRTEEIERVRNRVRERISKEESIFASIPAENYNVASDDLFEFDYSSEKNLSREVLDEIVRHNNILIDFSGGQYETKSTNIVGKARITRSIENVRNLFDFPGFYSNNLKVVQMSDNTFQIVLADGTRIQLPGDVKINSSRSLSLTNDIFVAELAEYNEGYEISRCYVGFRINRDILGKQNWNKSRMEINRGTDAGCGGGRMNKNFGIGCLALIIGLSSLFFLLYYMAVSFN